MVDSKKFSEVWPHVVKIRPEVMYDDIMSWALERAEPVGLNTRDIYTSFSLLHYGFKDRQLAMEFKLRFG